MKPEKRKREAWGESSDVDNFKGKFRMHNNARLLFTIDLHVRSLGSF